MVSLGLCKSHYLPINPLSANRKRGIIPSGFCDAKHRLLFLGHLAHPPMRGLQNYHIGRQSPQAIALLVSFADRRQTLCPSLRSLVDFQLRYWQTELLDTTSIAAEN